MQQRTNPKVNFRLHRCRAMFSLNKKDCLCAQGTISVGIDASDIFEAYYDEDDTRG